MHPASLMSDAVPRRIAHAGRDPILVHSIYRSVVNLSTADGLLTIASRDAGGLPNGILADLGPDWRTIGLRAGMVVHASDASVRVPDVGLEIGLDDAPRWSPRFASPGELAGAATLGWGRRAAATRAIARARASGRWFGCPARADGPPNDLGVRRAPPGPSWGAS